MGYVSIMEEGILQNKNYKLYYNYNKFSQNFHNS